MSVQQNAGTGNETASQAAVQATTAPAQSGAEQGATQQQDAITAPQQEQQSAEQNPAESDAIAGALPDAEQAEQQEQADGEGEGGESDDQAEAEAFELELPEGYNKEDPMFTGFMETVKESGMKKEQAQKLFDMHENAQRGLMDAVQNTMKQDMERINTEWQKACQTDPEFGGERFEASRNHVTAAIRRFVPVEEQAEFVDFYRQANLHNCPHMFKMLARIGQATSEAGPVASDASNAEQNTGIAARLYPHLPSARK